MQFTPSNFIANLSYMGLGLLGIFVVIGIIILVYVFTGFQTPTYIVGVCWLVVGLIIGAVKSKGYKEVPEAFKHLEV